MKYGIMLPSRGELALPENIIPIAKKADELGFSVMMFPDHIVLPNEVDSPYPYSQSGIFPATDTNEATEQLTMLAFLAGQTEFIRLVTSVMIVPHRPPVLTAKILSTIDVLSKGRVTVGLELAGCKRSSKCCKHRPSRNEARLPTNTSGFSRSCGPASPPALKESTAVSLISPSCPSRCKSRIHPSGWAARAAGPCAALPSWATVGNPSGPTTSFL